MKLKTFILSMGLSLTPIAAWSFSLADCAGHPHLAHHVFEDDHLVLGNGVVTYRIKAAICTDDGGCTHSEQQVVAACGSGQTLAFMIKLDRPTDGVEFDRSEETSDLLTELANAETEYSLDDLKDVLGRHDHAVAESVLAEENCACAASFPQLRNGKAAFEGI